MSSEKRIIDRCWLFQIQKGRNMKQLYYKNIKPNVVKILTSCLLNKFTANEFSWTIKTDEFEINVSVSSHLSLDLWIKASENGDKLLFDPVLQILALGSIGGYSITINCIKLLEKCKYCINSGKYNNLQQNCGKVMYLVRYE